MPDQCPISKKAFLIVSCENSGLLLVHAYDSAWCALSNIENCNKVGLITTIL